MKEGRIQISIFAGRSMIFTFVPPPFSTLGVLGDIVMFFVSIIFFLLTVSQTGFYNYTAPTVLNLLKGIFVTH